MTTKAVEKGNHEYKPMPTEKKNSKSKKKTKKKKLDDFEKTLAFEMFYNVFDSVYTA
jgi:hypothetical protein